MLFFKSEIEDLEQLFAFEKSDLENDFDEIELDAINQLGVLRHSSHLYLDTNIKFFPTKGQAHPQGSDLPPAHTAYITCYYNEKTNLDDILPKFFDIMHPDYNISIGNFINIKYRIFEQSRPQKKIKNQFLNFRRLVLKYNVKNIRNFRW